MTPWLAGADHRERPSSIVAPMATVGQQLQRRPGGPSGVVPPTDAAIAAAANRIERKWNRRRRPGGGPSGSRCRPRARESMDKEEERATPPKPLVFQCRLLAMTPWLAGADRPSSIVAPMATVGQQLQRRPAGPSGSA